jgi:hypothetical protein
MNLCAKTGKVMHASEKSAVESHVSLVAGHQFIVFKCRACGFFHWGNKQNRKKKPDEWPEIKKRFRPGMRIEMDEDGEIKL